MAGKADSGLEQPTSVGLLVQPSIPSNLERLLFLVCLLGHTLQSPTTACSNFADMLAEDDDDIDKEQKNDLAFQARRL